MRKSFLLSLYVFVLAFLSSPSAYALNNMDWVDRMLSETGTCVPYSFYQPKIGKPVCPLEEKVLEIQKNFFSSRESENLISSRKDFQERISACLDPEGAMSDYYSSPDTKRDPTEYLRFCPKYFPDLIESAITVIEETEDDYKDMEQQLARLRASYTPLRLKYENKEISHQEYTNRLDATGYKIKTLTKEMEDSAHATSKALLRDLKVAQNNFRTTYEKIWKERLAKEFSIKRLFNIDVPQAKVREYFRDPEFNNDNYGYVIYRHSEPWENLSFFQAGLRCLILKDYAYENNLSISAVKDEARYHCQKAVFSSERELVDNFRVIKTKIIKVKQDVKGTLSNPDVRDDVKQAILENIKEMSYELWLLEMFNNDTKRYFIPIPRN